MGDSSKKYLNTPLNFSKSSLTRQILEFDATLEGIEEMIWLRRVLFRIYNLAKGIDIDVFAPCEEEEDLRAGRGSDKPPTTTTLSRIRRRKKNKKKKRSDPPKE
jgi:hypothetical protein